MYYERQASRTGVLCLLRTVHCDLEIVNYKLLTLTSASETWIHSQWIGDCAECSWSVTCVLLIEPFSFMHVFSISVLTFSEKRVWSTFLVAKPELEIVDYEDQIQIKRQPAKLVRQMQSLNCSAPFMHSPAAFSLFWAEVMVARLFAFWQCMLYSTGRTVRYERWTVNC